MTMMPVLQYYNMSKPITVQPAIGLLSDAGETAYFFHIEGTRTHEAKHIEQGCHFQTLHRSYTGRAHNLEYGG